jgi:hypothetical protein
VNVSKLIAELQKMPGTLEVRFAQEWNTADHDSGIDYVDIDSVQKMIEESDKHPAPKCMVVLSV